MTSSARSARTSTAGAWTRRWSTGARAHPAGPASAHRAVRPRLTGGGEGRVLHTLESLSSPKTRIERRFDLDVVRQRKAESDHDLTIDGPNLAAQAIAAGLVDVYHLCMTSTVVGGRKRFFPEGVCLELDLVEERPLRQRFDLRALPSPLTCWGTGWLLTPTHLVRLGLSICGVTPLQSTRWATFWFSHPPCPRAAAQVVMFHRPRC